MWLCSTSLTSCKVLLPHFLEAGWGGTFQCFLVRQGKLICADIRRAFCSSFCPAQVQNETKSSAFSPFSLWALTWRHLQAGKLCLVGWIPALSPSPLLHLRRMWMFLENWGEEWCFTQRGSPVQNFSGRCYLVHAPREGNAFKTGFPQIKALRISSLIQKYCSQTLENQWLYAALQLTLESPEKLWYPSPVFAQST